MIFGLDYLGGARYPDLVLREHPQDWAAGFFFEVDGFGRSLPLAEKLAATGRCPRMRFQLMWKDDHRFRESDFPEIAKRARKVSEFAARHPAIDVRASGACEHELDQRDAQKLAGMVKAAAPNCLFVNTPSSKGALLKGEINEYHGFRKSPAPGRHDFSFDGTACVDSDIESYKRNYRDADTFYFWEPRFNLNWELGLPKIPRAQRKGYPDSGLIDSVIYEHRDRGAVKIPQGWTYKSHSENKGKNDPRAELPCFIIPPKASRVDLVADNGQVVAVAPRYPKPYVDGRWRYYFSDWGYLIAEKARRIQGHPLCAVVVDGKKRGVINAAFRSGSYHD